VGNPAHPLSVADAVISPILAYEAPASSPCTCPRTPPLRPPEGGRRSGGGAAG